MARRGRQRRELSRSVVQELIRRQTHVLVNCSYVGVDAEVPSVLGDELLADSSTSVGGEVDIGLVTGLADEIHQSERVKNDGCGKSMKRIIEGLSQQRKWRLTF